MLNKKYGKIIATALAVTSLLGGFALGNNEKEINGVSIKTAYAADSQSTGLSTPTGIISGKIKYSNKIPENPTLNELKAVSVSVNPTNNPEFFEPHMTTGTMLLSAGKMYISNNIYHYSYYYKDLDIQVDDFYHVYSMKLGSEGKVIKEYSVATYTDGQLMVKENYSIEYTDSKAYNYILNEGKVTPPVEPEVPTQPENKTYSASRLGGATRWETSTAIAKEVNGNKLDAVVLANAYDFPDALTGTTLAGNKNAPILLVGNNERDAVTLNYIKNNLKSTGTVYVLGGSTAISDATLNKVKSIGFKNIKRLGGSDRYATNMAVVNELNVAKGSNIVIANSMSYADSLSISGISGANNMPIFLVNGELTSSTIDKIKSIAPKNIYIVGSTTVVNSNIEKQLKSYGNVVRLGGKDRFETSLKIANYFTGASQTTALVSYGLNFPDALAGGALASKTSSPILLVNGDVTAQKAFLDKSNINKLFILGDKNVVSDGIVGQLTK